MKRVLKSAVVWTGVWFLSAFLFVFLFTHRIMGRSGEPTPTTPYYAAQGPRLPEWHMSHQGGRRGIPSGLETVERGAIGWSRKKLCA